MGGDLATRKAVSPYTQRMLQWRVHCANGSAGVRCFKRPCGDAGAAPCAEAAICEANYCAGGSGKALACRGEFRCVHSYLILLWSP